MHLFIVSLLALSVHGHSIIYRTNLLGYTPARGEFAVESGYAQGYVRYLDANGVERIIPYYYPEPLYGLRSLSYGIGVNSSPLVHGGLKSETSQQQNALFRAWSEQRYNALKSEIDHLRSEGKQPSASMIAQFEPLELIIKAGAFENISGLSPQIQRAREEHLRIWNEARLKVLQTEAQQKQLQSKTQIVNKVQAQQQDAQLKQYVGLQSSAQGTAQLKQLSGMQTHINLAPEVAQNQVNQLQSTQQIEKAYLKKLNEANNNEKQYINGQVKLKYVQGSQLVQEPVEVLRAREEHLKLLNEAKLKSKEQTTQVKPYDATAGYSYAPGQTLQVVQETPEVKQAREEHLRLLEQAKQRTQIEGKYNKANDGSYKSDYAEGNYQQENQASLKFVAGIQQPIQQGSQQQATYQTAGLKSNYQVASSQQQQSSSPVQDTPEVIRAREEHLRILNEAKQRFADRIADDQDRAKLEERQRQAEQMLELELRKEEKKQMEIELQREAERVREEQRLLEAERLALQQEEQRRIESERYAEEQRLKAEQEEQLKYRTQEQMQLQSQIENKFITNAQLQSQSIQQPSPNAYFLRVQANQPRTVLTKVPSSGTYIIGAGQQPQQLDVAATPENPFLVRYAHPTLSAAGIIKQEYNKPLTLIENNQQQQQQQLKSDSSVSASAISTHSGVILKGDNSALSTETSAYSSGLSEIDKATREHLRAHEIALEQLRLANLKNSFKADCN